MKPFKEAKWIWAQNHTGVNIYCNFRKTFELQEEVLLAKVRVSAHHFFKLYVNGMLISSVCAPALTVYPKTKFYLEYSVEPYLTKGKNTFAAEVLYLGGDGQNSVNGLPCFILEAEIRTQSGLLYIVSDEYFKCLKETGYQNGLPYQQGRGLTPVSSYNTSVTGTDWTKPSYDDWYWENSVLSPANVQGIRLVKQFIPEGRTLREIDPQPLQGQGTTCQVFDAGEILTGFVRLQVNKSCAGRIRVRYSEDLENSRVKHNVANEPTENYYDELVYKDNEQITWQADFTYKAFRYFEITGYDRPILPEEIKAVKAGTAIEQHGDFFCSDPLLNDIYKACIETQKNNTIGLLADCPHREQAQYLGDSFLQSRLLTYNFKYAKEMLRKVLQDFADMQQPDGYFPFVCPGSWMDTPYFLRIPEYDLYLVSILWTLWTHYEDQSSVEKYYPVAAKMLAYYLSLVDGTGLIPQHKGWHISDWPYSKVDQSGKYLSAQNLWCMMALEQMAKMAGLLKNGEEALWQQKYEQLKAAIHTHLFDTEKGLVRDCSGSAAYHSGINALAVKAGLIDEGQVPNVLNYILNKQPETKTILSYELLDVLCSHGYIQNALNFIIGDDQTGWGRMIRLGYQTIWESFDNIESHSHAWNGYPARILQQYVLGVQPTAAGFKSVVIKPCLCSLTHAEGTVYTLYGTIKVDCCMLEEKAVFIIVIPSKIEAVLEYNDIQTVLKAGKNELIFDR